MPWRVGIPALFEPDQTQRMKCERADMIIGAKEDGDPAYTIL